MNRLTLILFAIISITIAQQEDPAVTKFREYLRINSAHPDPIYDGCIAWLRAQAAELGLPFYTESYEEPHSFAVWMTWNGTNPGLKSILIDSHMDVVAVDESKWVHNPFSAFKDTNGNIYARGAIDMKSTTVAVLEAVRRLKASGFNPLRTIHIMILPDEELYSRGVKDFVNSTTFTNMNIGFALDEAVANPHQDDDNLLITFTEKSVWQFNYTVFGNAQHASTLPEVTAGQKLQVVMDRLFAYRASQLDLLQQPGVTLANLTTLNLVRIGGGLGNNIIPHELWASWDMRIVTKPGWNFSDFDAMLNSIATEAGNDTMLTFLVKTEDYASTPTEESNIWWVTLEETCAQLNVSCTPNIPNGVTDGRYIRNTGIPVFGLNTFTKTPPLAHQDNEYINEAAFLQGITRWGKFIQNFAMVSQALHP